MTTSYKLLLFAHILSVVALVGSSIGTHVLALRARAAGPARTADFVADVEWLGRRLQAPAAALVLAFGIWLGRDAGWDFSETWLVLGMVGFAVCAVISGGYVGPASRRVLALITSHGPADPGVLAGVRRVLVVSWIELAILIAIMLDMAVKPGV
ncbi:MAG TPA: DUF2269 family protein [Jatrophihabitantaceae bacterium]|nr:DUF2269 family protein [Jatrophihabitantaceae bacterium]